MAGVNSEFNNLQFSGSKVPINLNRKFSSLQEFLEIASKPTVEG